MNLNNIFTLSHRVEVYLPSKTKDGDTISPSVRSGVEMEIGKNLTMLFGGATSSEGHGFYQHLDGRMTLEQVTIIFAFAETLDEQAITVLLDLASYIKTVLSQESVMLTLDGKAYFI